MKQFNEYKIDHINQKLTESLKNISDAFVAIDANWKYNFVNQKTAIILSKRPEDIIGENTQILFTDDSGTAYHKFYYKAMKKKPFENYYALWERYSENRLVISKKKLVVFCKDKTERELAKKHWEFLIENYLEILFK